MRFNATAILGIVVISIFLTAASCDSTGKQADDTVSSPWYGGYEGLVATFEDIGTVSDTGAENEVWEDEAFPVTVELNNKGEYTIPAHDILLEIKGISRSDFTGLDFTKDNTEEIEKVSEYMRDGGVTYIDFGEASYMNLVGTHYDATLFLYFTYPYETYINIPKVCYKENIKDHTVCDVDETKQAFASGGPIQIGTVEERYIGKGKILLEIPIRNEQKGYAKATDNDNFRPEWDEVYFEINDPDWECSSRGDPNIARISYSGDRSSEEVKIVCTNKNLEAGANFMRAVTVKLSYYYQDWIEQTVRIRENPE